MPLLYGLIIFVALIVIYNVYKTPETFVIVRDENNKEVVLSPQEATRLGIVDNAPVYDGRDRVF
jgi:hypothetical protein